MSDTFDYKEIKSPGEWDEHRDCTKGKAERVELNGSRSVFTTCEDHHVAHFASTKRPPRS